MGKSYSVRRESAAFWFVGLNLPESKPRQDLGEEEIASDVFGFEHVATDGVVGGAKVALVSGLVRRAEGAETYLGSWGPVGLTTLGEREAFEAVRWTSNDRSHLSHADAELSADDHQPKDVSQAKVDSSEDTFDKPRSSMI
jgi:hypothetical protein